MGPCVYTIKQSYLVPNVQGQEAHANQGLAEFVEPLALKNLALLWPQQSRTIACSQPLWHRRDQRNGLSSVVASVPRQCQRAPGCGCRAEFCSQEVKPGLSGQPAQPQPWRTSLVAGCGYGAQREAGTGSVSWCPIYPQLLQHTKQVHI